MSIRDKLRKWLGIELDKSRSDACTRVLQSQVDETNSRIESLAETVSYNLFKCEKLYVDANKCIHDVSEQNKFLNMKLDLLMQGKS